MFVSTGSSAGFQFTNISFENKKVMFRHFHIADLKDKLKTQKFSYQVWECKLTCLFIREKMEQMQSFVLLLLFLMFVKVITFLVAGSKV